MQMSQQAESQSGALAVSLTYYRAWTADDFERAMTFIDNDIACDAPSEKLDGAAAFRRFMEPFAQILTRAS